MAAADRLYPPLPHRGRIDEDNAVHCQLTRRKTKNIQIWRSTSDQENGGSTFTLTHRRTDKGYPTDRKMRLKKLTATLASNLLPDSRLVRSPACLPCCRSSLMPWSLADASPRAALLLGHGRHSRRRRSRAVAWGVLDGRASSHR